LSTSLSFVLEHLKTVFGVFTQFSSRQSKDRKEAKERKYLKKCSTLFSSVEIVEKERIYSSLGPLLPLLSRLRPVEEGTKGTRYR
jgi:hypothetical protein